MAPADTAVAWRMAEVLDDPSAAPQAPAAAKALLGLLASVRSPELSSGALARLRAARVDGAG